MEEFIQIMIVGICVGSIYGLIGLAFTSIYNATGALNFAQGEFIMMGSVGAWLFLTKLHWPIIWALLISIVVVSIVGIIMQWFIVSPIFKSGGSIINIMLATLAFGMALSGTVGGITYWNFLGVEPFLGNKIWGFRGVFVTPQNALIIFATALVVFGYWIFQTKTMIGRALTASGINPELASLNAISVSKMIAIAFIISAVISVIAGGLLAPLIGAQASMGLNLVIKAFIAVVIGGLGSAYGAVIGGLVLGVVHTLLTGYFSSLFAEMGAFILFILVLLIRPHGLFVVGKVR